MSYRFDALTGNELGKALMAFFWVAGMLIGMSRSLVFRLEDRRIAAHLRAVERLLRRRDTSGMASSLQRRRTEMLDRLADYRRRAVFPRNHSGRLLSPIFVDSDIRECAVAHLIGRDVDLVDEISGSHNLARIREMPHPALGRWQRESGLDVGELALIQPAYPESATTVAFAAVPGVVVFLVGMLGAWLSHGLRRLRFRLADISPSNRVAVFAVLTALAGLWLIGEARHAWGLPVAEAGSYAMVYVWRDVAYGVVVWALMALGVVGVVFGLATLLRRIIAATSWRVSVGNSSLFVRLERGAFLLTAACLAMVGPLVWAWTVITVTQVLSHGRLCGSGRVLLSQWLPLPHTRCLLDGQIVATSYADSAFVALALAPIVWLVARRILRARSQPSPITSHHPTR